MKPVGHIEYFVRSSLRNPRETCAHIIVGPEMIKTCFDPTQHFTQLYAT